MLEFREEVPESTEEAIGRASSNGEIDVRSLMGFAVCQGSEEVDGRAAKSSENLDRLSEIASVADRELEILDCR